MSASLSGPGSRPTGRASKAVSPVPASIPSADTADSILRDLFCGDEVDVALAGNPTRMDAMLDRVRRYIAETGADDGKAA